jgi:Family of unknown function (DUF5706)
MDDNDRYLLDINKDNLARVVGFAGTYDTKANFLLTVILALTAYLVAELPSYVDANAKHPTHTWFALLDPSFVGCVGLFVWDVVLIVLTSRPNVTQHSQKHSPLFFQSIAATSLNEFRKVMTSLPVNNAIDLIAEQTYDNAKIVARKHARVHDAINRFFLGAKAYLGTLMGEIGELITARYGLKPQDEK